MLNTIDRTGKVLNLFTAEAPDWGVTEVAAALRLPKSTAFDLLASLAGIGLLQQTSQDRYRLGWRVLLFSRRLMGSTCFSVHTQRSVAQLAGQLSAVVTIGAWDSEGVVCISTASADCSDAAVALGAHLPGHASALGKLLLAQLPWPKVHEHIDRCGLPKLTENSVSDIDLFRVQLLAARRDDLAVDDGETMVGRSCIAVGIYPREQRALAALSISMPTQRLQSRRDECIRAARRAASHIVEQGTAP